MAVVGGATGYGLGQSGGSGITGVIAGGMANPSRGFNVRGAIVAGATGWFGGAEGSVFGGTFMGAIEGGLNAASTRNPNGWNAFAGPALKGLRGGLVGVLASKGAEALVDAANSEFGSCGCGK